MDRNDLLKTLEERNLTEIIELIEDAEAGKLEELELVESLGLLRDEQLNMAVLDHLASEGVKIIYVNEED